MNYKRMGRSGLKVSTMCLGTITFGGQVNETEAETIVKYALEAGVNFFDTADAYINGRSEEILGKALKGARESVVLATKLGRWKSGPGVNDAGLSRKHIMREVENSLRRLGTEYIDLYICHAPDDGTPIEETLRALDDLIHDGKVRYIACSNFRAFQLYEALWTSERCNLFRFDCIQTPYNLITRDIEYELLPLCANRGVGVTVYNPLAAGLLTGKHDPSRLPQAGTRFAAGAFGQHYSDRYWLPRNFEAVAKLKKYTDDHNYKLAQFALAWTLNNPVVTSVICGVTSLDQLKQNLGAIDVKLTSEDLEMCEKVWEDISPPRFLYGKPYSTI